MTTARPDLVIRGGTVVTDTWSGAATVTVAAGRITGVLDPAADVAGADHERIRTTIAAAGTLCRRRTTDIGG